MATLYSRFFATTTNRAVQKHFLRWLLSLVTFSFIILRFQSEEVQLFKHAATDCCGNKDCHIGEIGFLSANACKMPAHGTEMRRYLQALSKNDSIRFCSMGLGCFLMSGAETIYLYLPSMETECLLHGFIVEPICIKNIYIYIYLKRPFGLHCCKTYV